MKQTSLTPPESKILGGETVAKAFFANYPLEQIEKKLWTQLELVPGAEGTTVAADLAFNEDLMAMLRDLHHFELRQSLVFLRPSFTELTLVSVEGVINLIKKAIPVGVIYNLSKSKDELDLIVILEKSCTIAYTEFESILNLAILGFQKGTCTVHNYGLLNSLIANGHIFYLTACVEENVVYRKDDAEVFTTLNQNQVQLTKVKAAVLFKNGFEKAESFFEGALLYISHGRYEMAIFMLHQACELTYRTLLAGLRGKDLKCHSPAVLRKHIKRFSPKIIGMFSVDEATELFYLGLLEEAYVKARYDLHYTIDRDLVVFLKERVGLLLDCALAIFNGRMSAIDSLLANDDWVRQYCGVET